MFCNVILKNFPSTSNILQVKIVYKLYKYTYKWKCVVWETFLCHKFSSFFIWIFFFLLLNTAMKSQRKENAERKKNGSFNKERNGNFLFVFFLNSFLFLYYFSCGEQSFVSTSFVHHQPKAISQSFSYFSSYFRFSFFFLCMILYE